MLGEDCIAKIAHIFCGDDEGYYSYKSGPQLVAFFNQYFQYNDQYYSGFPSRWTYVRDKIIALLNAGKGDSFFDVSLSRAYLMKDLNIDEVSAAEKSTRILAEYNRILHQDAYLITSNSGHFRLIQENEDMVLIGSGGFANVFLQKSTGLIVKKLKDDFLTDQGIRHRFKREFMLTKSLEDLFGIIKVYSFSEGTCSYTMERAERTLEQYVLSNDLHDETKITCIRQILYIMSKVHERGIIHRDISPNNIFIISGGLRIADFGLGKDLNILASHQTIHTNAVGQFFYCAPEQFMMLKDADKRSDVYSIGRVINFIMTCDPQNSNHRFASVTQKATASDSSFRFADASQLSSFFEKKLKFVNDEKKENDFKEKIATKQYDMDVEDFICDMRAEEISRWIMNEEKGFSSALIKFMETDEDKALHVVQSVESTYRDVCKYSFDANDPFAYFSARIIRGNFSFTVKEIAASVLRDIAWFVNRFSAQRIIETLLLEDIDPMIKDLLHK